MEEQTPRHLHHSKPNQPQTNEGGTPIVHIENTHQSKQPESEKVITQQRKRSWRKFFTIPLIIGGIITAAYFFLLTGEPTKSTNQIDSLPVKSLETTVKKLESLEKKPELPIPAKDGLNKYDNKIEEEIVEKQADELPHFYYQDFDKTDDALQAFLKNIGCGSGTIVSFVVEKNGSTSGIEIRDCKDAICKLKIENALIKMPNWIPAKKAGKAIRFSYSARM
jgi:hypothetical protein